VAGIEMKKRLWVRRVVQVIAGSNLLVICAGMIWGLKWPFLAVPLLFVAMSLIQHFYKADLVIDPAPMNTKILDIQPTLAG
jgi:hypothetical protein